MEDAEYNDGPRAPIPRVLFTAEEVAESIGAKPVSVWLMCNTKEFPRIHVPGEDAPRFELGAVLNWLKEHTAREKPGWGYRIVQPQPSAPRVIGVNRGIDGLR